MNMSDIEFQNNFGCLDQYTSNRLYIHYSVKRQLHW